MLFTLMTHADFDKMLEKYVLPKDLPYVKETVNSLRQKVQRNTLFDCHVCKTVKQGGWLDLGCYGERDTAAKAWPAGRYRLLF